MDGREDGGRGHLAGKVLPALAVLAAHHGADEPVPGVEAMHATENVTGSAAHNVERLLGYDVGAHVHAESCQGSPDAR
jgi:aminoglycoside phosphotransferase (APT) family kinase protein